MKDFLTSCKLCGGKVASTAQCCPHCGCNSFLSDSALQHSIDLVEEEIKRDEKRQIQAVKEAIKTKVQKVPIELEPYVNWPEEYGSNRAMPQNFWWSIKIDGKTPELYHDLYAADDAPDFLVADIFLPGTHRVEVTYHSKYMYLDKTRDYSNYIGSVPQTYCQELVFPEGKIYYSIRISVKTWDIKPHVFKKPVYYASGLCLEVASSEPEKYHYKWIQEDCIIREWRFKTES